MKFSSEFRCQRQVGGIGRSHSSAARNRKIESSFVAAGQTLTAKLQELGIDADAL
jgi:hypothetical protein